MVKQLGTLTFFLTVSCADLRWKELSINFKLNVIDIENKDIYIYIYIYIYMYNVYVYIYIYIYI